jgi:hypothetical protein
MLRYVGAGGAVKGTVPALGGRPAPILERLDQEDSPARGPLNRISNKLVREVSFLNLLLCRHTLIVIVIISP